MAFTAPPPHKGFFPFSKLATNTDEHPLLYFSYFAHARQVSMGRNMPGKLYIRVVGLESMMSLMFTVSTSLRHQMDKVF